jgi:hypothetical protein
VYEAELGALQDERAPRGDRDNRTDEIVDYSKGGYTAPGLAPPVQWRQPAHLDRVTKVQREHAEQVAASTMTSWDEVANRAPDSRMVTFPAPSLGPEPGIRGGRERPHGAEVNAAAGGNLYRPAPMSAVQMRATQPGRFGPNVREPVQATSAHFESNVPNLVRQEEVQAEQVRQASENLRTQAGYASWRR